MGTNLGSTRFTIRVTVLVTALGGFPCASATTLDDETTSASPSAGSPPIEWVLDGLPVSTAQQLTQQTPLALHDGALYTINLEPGPDGDSPGRELLTVLRRGSRDETGKWTWERKVVDEHTPFNPWHTPPAVGVDRLGRVHVAYAMHNTPWLYAVSVRPADIGELRYRGQTVSREALDRAVAENRSDFPTLGSGAIPGNQITYPAFFNDRDGELWVTYRFAAKPARPFAERTMSAGIARHDARSDTWSAVGGQVPARPGRDYEPDPRGDDPTPRALAARTGWTLYHPRVAFAPDNTLHASWFWREGGAGPAVTRPCHLFSRDARRFLELAESGSESDAVPVSLPFPLERCGNVAHDPDRAYHTVGNLTVNSRGEPHMVLSPVDGPRELHYRSANEWRTEPLPYSATEIFFDRDDNLWAVASGPNIFVKRDGERDWLAVHKSDERRFCSARSAIDSDGPSDRAYLYVDHCGEPNVSIIAFDLDVPEARP